MSSLNSKGLCPIGAKERHERSAQSKGMTVKKKQNERNKAGYTGERSDGSFGTHKESKKTKIKPVSKDKANELAVLAQIKKRKISIQGKKCELCGKSGEVDLFHIVGVGNKEYSTNETNLLLSCRFCHLIWGANDFEKILKFVNYQDILVRLKSLNEGLYWKFVHRIERYLSQE
jgi:hypothetical protein